MAKKDIDAIPDLDERDLEVPGESPETTETTEPAEPAKEEAKVQLVTSDQLTKYKLDNLSLEVQDLNSKLQDLVLHTKALVEVLRKRK